MSGKKSRKNSQYQKKPRNHPLKSTWGAAIISFVKEFFLNDIDVPGHIEYNENLSKEGIRKKDLIWGAIFLITASVLVVEPILSWDVLIEQSVPSRVAILISLEGFGIALGILGIITIKKALNKKSR